MANPFRESEMYENSYNCLRRRYPASEGWELTPQHHHGTYVPDFTCFKETKNYTYKVICEVKAKPTLHAKDIAQINKYVKNVAGKNVKIKNRILIVPSGCNIENVRDLIEYHEIEVIFLRAFRV